MTDEQKAAYVNAMAACVNARVSAMAAENVRRVSQGEAISYGEEAFDDLIVEYGIHHNAVLGLFHS